MKKLGNTGMVLFTATVLIASSSYAKESKLPNLEKLCAKECPGVTGLKDIMECVEKKEHGEQTPETKKFLKSKCFITHEKHEDEYRKTANMKPESEESEKVEKSEKN